jgi:hypothetical protein
MYVPAVPRLTIGVLVARRSTFPAWTLVNLTRIGSARKNMSLKNMVVTCWGGVRKSTGDIVEASQYLSMCTGSTFFPAG